MGIAKKYRLVTENNFGADDISFIPDPLIRKDLQDIEDDYPTRDKDFLLRSGTFQRQAKDVQRISKFLTSPEGLLFTAKQNLLSRTGVKTEASGLINEGPYLPDNTILQVSQVGIGGHQAKNGLDNGIVGGVASLLGFNTPGRLPQYIETVNNQQDSNTNRLVQLKNTKIDTSLDENGPTRIERAIAALNGTDGTSLFGRIRNAANVLLQQGDLVSPRRNEILRYGGGPGSEAGVGETISQRVTYTPLEDQIAFNPNIADQLGIDSPNLPDRNPVNEVLGSGAIEAIQGVTGQNINPGKIRDGLTNASKLFDRGRQIANDVTRITDSLGPNFTEGSVVDDTTPETAPEDNSFTLNREQIDQKGEEAQQTRHQIKDDFRNEFDRATNPKILGDSLSYTDPESFIDTRVNHGTPGDNNRTSETTLDKVNALTLYQSEFATQNTVKNDLVKFRIAAVDTENPSNSVFIHFRAFLESFGDNFSAEWNSKKYMGRGENFYKYNGFDRTISMSWKVVAQSKPELIQMYTKLNFLASNLAPDYTTAGYMGGPLVKLTVGGYLLEQYGFINSLDYTIPENSPWELGIVPEGQDNRGVGGTKSEDDSVKELAKYIDVNMNFTPIHRFAVEKQKNEYQNDDGAVSKFGLQRYIALSNYPNIDSGNSNYDRDLPTGVAREKESVINRPETTGVQQLETNLIPTASPLPTNLLRERANQPTTRRQMRERRRELRQQNRLVTRG